MLLDLVELAAPPGLWPRLGPPRLRTGAQNVPGIALSVADSFGSMPRSLRLDRISPPCDVSSSRIPGRSSNQFQRSLIPALAFDLPSN